MQPVLDPSAVWSQGSQAQEPILVSAKTMLESSSYLIRTARSLAINPKDPPTWSVLAGHSHTVSDSIKSLITSIRLVSPPEITRDLHLNRARGSSLSGLVFNSNVLTMIIFSFLSLRSVVALVTIIITNLCHILFQAFNLYYLI